MSLYFSVIAFCVMLGGYAIVRAQAPTQESTAIDVAVLQRQVQEIQGSDLPAQIAAMRERMLRTENAVDNLTKKVDEATGYVKLVLFGILALIGHRAWSILYGPKEPGSTDSSEGIPIIGRRRK